MSDAERTLAERRHLNFPHAVDSACAFLKELGFNVVESGPTIVVFKNGNLLVTFYHGRHSWEIGLEVSNGEETYSLFSILSVAGMPFADKYRNPVAASGPDVTSGVRKVAGLLSQYGQAALAGDSAFFERLQQRRRDWSLSIHINQTRSKANAAFRERRYKEAAAFYIDIEQALTPAEQKKLAIARRKSGEH